MICIFKNTAKKKQLIETNGEYVLDNICTYGMITEGLNDEFTLEIEFEILDTVKKELYDLITEEGILKVEDEYGDEFFVINEIYKTSDSIRAIARQITIAETLDLFLEDVRPEKQNGAGALTHIFSNTTCTHEIVVNSDISTISTAYYNRKTVYEALHDADMSFQERWGGEVYRRQFNLHINNKVGSYKGVKIKSNKNLTGFEENTTKDTVCTRIYPKGFNGITIEEKYIDSENIGMYKRPISRVYTFEDVKVRDENTGEDEEVFETLEEAQEELKKRAKALFEEDKVDLIKAYYTINHVDLRTTEEYKNYSATEMTCIGDEVDVEEETLGIDIRTRVVKRKYNILTKEREETELSNVGLKRVITLPDLEKEIEKIPNTESFLEAAKEIATGLINAGIKNSHVVVRKNEILIMDSDDINTAQKVWRFNVNGLGYSSTGYHGIFGLAMTMDGSIVADFINVGILNANLIKAGVIKSLNEKTWINMEDGSFNFADKIKCDGEKFEIELGDVSVNLVNNGSFNNGIEGWNKVNITIGTPSFYNSERNWCNFYTTVSEGERYGENIFDILPNKVYNFSMLLAQYSASKTFYRIRVETKNKNSDAWTVIKEFTGNTSATRSKPEQLSYTFKSASTVEKCRIWIGKLDGEVFDIYVSDLFMGTGTLYARKSEFEILDTKISSKVSENDFGTLVEQNAHAVKIAWNNNSKYVQFENGGLAIYNGAVNENQKRAFFDERGNHFWRDGYYVGKIGTNQYSNNTSIKGINFDLEYQGGYMTWAVKKTSAASTYTMMWSYANKTIGNYEAGKLHAGCDIDMHNYTLRNVRFEGGGINGTLMFTQIVGMNGDGTANRWYNNSKLVFQNGILIDATWGNV